MIDTVERSGEVVSFAQGMAQIRLERPSGCSACGSRGSCASDGAAAQVIHRPLPAGTKPGDQVRVSLPSSSVTLAALLGYLLPPVCLLVGAIVASMCYAGDVAAVLGAGFGFVAGLLLARLISRFVIVRETVSSLCSPDLQAGEHP